MYILYTAGHSATNIISYFRFHNCGQSLRSSVGGEGAARRAQRERVRPLPSLHSMLLQLH